jgi:hypothetical protein
LIQASIIERRFLGDLSATYSEFQSRQAFFIPQRPMLDSRDGVRFVNASWSQPFQDPCKAIEAIDKIQGYESKGRKVIKAFDRVMNTLATGEYTDDVPGGILKKIPEANQFKKMFEERFKKGRGRFRKTQHRDVLRKARRREYEHQGRSSGRRSDAAHPHKAQPQHRPGTCRDCKIQYRIYGFRGDQLHGQSGKVDDRP